MRRTGSQVSVWLEKPVPDWQVCELAVHCTPLVHWVALNCPGSGVVQLSPVLEQAPDAPSAAQAEEIVQVRAVGS